MNETIKRKDFARVLKVTFPVTIPVLTGFMVLGLAYGVLMQTKGYGPLWAAAMSSIAFCGSMQFVAITLLTTVFDPVQAFLLSIMVNARHIFYGLTLLEKYKGLGWRRWICIYTLCDETFSLISTVNPPDDVDKGDFYLLLSALNWVYWVVGTIFGGMLGNLILVNTKGLDFALTALFTVLFIEQISKVENRPAAFIGVFATGVCLLIFKADNLVIPSMLLIFIILLAGRKKLCN